MIVAFNIAAQLFLRLLDVEFWIILDFLDQLVVAFNRRITAVASKLSTVRMIDKLSLQLSVFGPLQGASATEAAGWTHPLLHFHAATILVLDEVRGFYLVIPLVAHH